MKSTSQLRQEEEQWRNWRYAAQTVGKDENNDDTYLVQRTHDALTVVLIDVATHKTGVTGAEIQSSIAESMRCASPNASPSELIGDTHSVLSHYLAQHNARGVAAIMVLRLLPDGNCLWAHVGDTVLLLWQPVYQSGTSSRLILRNERQRRGNALLQSCGMRRAITPMVEEGCLKLEPGQRLLLASDGVYHDAMTLAAMKSWVDAYSRLSDVLMPSDLVRKIDTEARLTQPQADDRSLIVIERMGELS